MTETEHDAYWRGYARAVRDIDEEEGRPLTPRRRWLDSYRDPDLESVA